MDSRSCAHHFILFLLVLEMEQELGIAVTGEIQQHAASFESPSVVPVAVDHLAGQYPHELEDLTALYRSLHSQQECGRWD